MTSPDMEQNLQQYEYFINDVLKEDLKLIEEQLNKTNMQIAQINQQKNALKNVTDKKRHPNGFKTQFDLGNNFYMEATVPDTSTMLVNIGLNHFLEYSVPEAHKYLDDLIVEYTTKAEELRVKAAETKAHIKLMLVSFAERNESKKNN